MPPTIAPAYWTIGGVFALVAAAVVWDVRRRRIPNWLTASGAAFALILNVWLDGLAGLGLVAGGTAVGMAALLPGFFLGATGAGDVKLMAAAGGFLGPYGAFVAAVASISWGAVLALVTAAASALLGRQASPWPRYGLMLRRLVGTGQLDYIPPAKGEVMGRRFPFAVAIACGVMTAVFHLGPAALSPSAS